MEYKNSTQPCRKRAKTNADTVYCSTPALRQQKFPGIRRSTKAARTSAPSLQKDQSTLTQLDFCTPRGSSDFEDETEDGSVEDSKPRRKKRRKNTDGKRQSTLTQFDFLHPGRPGFGDEDFEIFDEMCHGGLSERIQDTQFPTQREESPGQDIVMATAMPDTESDTVIRDFAVRAESQQEIKDSQPSTPVRRHLLEIPSSQSPQSILFTDRSRRNLYSPHRSPLKERDTNISMERLRKTTPSKSIYRLRQGDAFDDSPIKSPVFRIPALPPPRIVEIIPDSDGADSNVVDSPRLHRFNSIIQDSQYDSMEKEITSDYPTQDMVPDSDRAEASLETQDIDYEYLDPACSALDRDAARYMQTQRLLDQQLGLHLDPRATSQSQVVPATYLPAESRAQDEHQSFYAEGHEERYPPRLIVDPIVNRNEEDGDSNEFHSLPGTPIKPEDSVPTNLPTHIEVVDLTSDDTVFEDAQPSTPPSSPPERPRKQSSQQQQSVLQAIGSSPPVMHPSQASTVDVTQYSPRRSGRVSLSPQLPQKIKLLSSQISQYSTLPQPPADFSSSSPIPRPPISSPKPGDEVGVKSHRYEIPSSPDSGFDSDAGEAEEGSGVNKRRTAIELLPDSLLDFSLPPPPPMSSWRKQRG